MIVNSDETSPDILDCEEAITHKLSDIDAAEILTAWAIEAEFSGDKERSERIRADRIKLLTSSYLRKFYEQRDSV